MFRSDASHSLFSAFLLSTRDGFFDLLGFARRAGFKVFEVDDANSNRFRFVASKTAELVTDPFEWSAIRSAGQLTVSGPVGVSNGCSFGTLELLQDAQPVPGQVHLEVSEQAPDTAEFCTQAIGRDRVSWTSEGPIEDIEQVVVSRRYRSLQTEETITHEVQVQ